MGIRKLFGHQVRVLKRILGHSREAVAVAVAVQGEEESVAAAAVRFVLFGEFCDGDEHFKGADRPEIYLKIQSVPCSKHTPSLL